MKLGLAHGRDGFIYHSDIRLIFERHVNMGNGSLASITTRHNGGETRRDQIKHSSIWI